MSLYDTLRKQLTPDLFSQVTDALGDDFDYDVVPRARLNKVIKQRNELRDQIAGTSQSQPGKPGSDGDDDDFKMPGAKEQPKAVDIEKLKAEWLKEQGDAVKEVKIKYAALEKLRAVHAIDPEIIYQAGLIDKSKITIADDGNISGLDDQITELTKNRTQLFQAGKQGADPGTGKRGGEGDDPSAVTKKEDFLKLSYEDQLKFKQNNPDVFKSFME